MTLAIIDYGAGNVQSVRFAFQRLGIEPIVSNNAEEILAADRVIFPGVGEASSAMRQLRACGLDRVIPVLRQPVLGICLGLQLLCRSTAEGGATTCLGVFPHDVARFPATGNVPHTGWNTIEHDASALLHGIASSAWVYFVHSYYAECGACTVATTTYLVPLSAALQRDNFYAVQFHPEKSSAIGARILGNFLELPS